ncbi:hypothetical protein AD998_18310 [bacterium 336/3]|nr:hypothetical protein AD998_18310 [bacterium 336/3]
MENNELIQEKAENSEDFLLSKEKFWTVHIQKNKAKQITISNLRIISILKGLGYYRHDLDNDAHTFVHIENNIVREVSEKTIRDVFFSHIEKMPSKLEKNLTRDELLEKLHAGIDSYLSKSKLERLNLNTPLMFVQDTKEQAFFFFKNGYVCVDKDKIELKPYSELHGFIWKNQIVNKELTIKAINEKELSQNGVFSKFVSFISKQDDPRVRQLASLMGYLLHNYRHGKRKSVCFTDSSLEDSNNGRSGKTLLAKSLGKLKSYTEIAGKDFDPKNKHKYQSCQLDTQIVHINDARNNFQFEALYNDITEGLNVEKKNKNPFIIQPRMIISSNKPLRIEGASDRDRVVEFELDNYFSDRHSPINEFGHIFFEEWDQEEWNKFYNFMFWCIKEYFNTGLQEPENTSLPIRKIRNETSIEFFEWIELKSEEFIESITKQAWFDKKELFNEFKNQNPDENEKLKQRTFTVWFKKYCAYKKLKVKEEKRRNPVNPKEFLELIAFEPF